MQKQVHKKELNLERANKIIVEAIEQSNQLNPPVINQAVKLKDFISSINLDTKLLFADVNSKYKLKSENINKGQPISILIGPEGDFSPQEREQILATPNLTSFTLSRNILRTDTAVISAISLVNFIHSDH